MRKLLVLFLCLAPAAWPQGKTFDNNLHGWLVYNGDHPVSDRWAVHFDAQWRSHEFAKPQQLLLRGAANYRLNSRVSLAAGYGFLATHRYGAHPTAVPFPEHRLYEQVAISAEGKGNAFQHRFRLEQRWIGLRGVLPDGARLELGTRYQNRIRYMLKMTRPLRGRLYLAAYNEIFMALPPFGGARAFDQNWAFAGTGWKLNDFHRIETGYLQQTVLQRNGHIMELNHTLHVSLNSTLPFRR